MDDTISDTASTVIEWAYKYHIKYLHKDSEPDFNISSADYYYFADVWGWSKTEVEGFFAEFYPYYLQSVICKQFVSDTLKYARNNGFSIKIITARRESKKQDVYSLTCQWLLQNNIYFDDLIIGVKDKSQFIKQHKTAMFIDDSFDQCIKTADRTNAKVLLMDTWYNNKLVLPNGIQRVYDWLEIKQLIRQVN
jgi:uncharacterized HAD superfamily protein